MQRQQNSVWLELLAVRKMNDGLRVEEVTRKHLSTE